MSETTSVTVIGRDGEVDAVEWRPNQTLMEALRDNDLPIAAECGGSAACATCHVHLDRRSYESYPAPQQYEVDMLEAEERYEPGASRLSCQIAFNSVVEDLTATIAAPALDW